jgi:hypothetical protein
MDWQPMIDECFERADRLGPRHALDMERAFRLLTAMREQRLTWDQAQTEFRAYLQERGSTSEQIASELENLRPHFEPWLW